MKLLRIALCAVLLSLAATDGAAASTGFDLRGKWDCCGQGGAGGQIFNITQMDLGSGAFSGEALQPSSQARFSPITGTADGNNVSLTTGPYDGSSYSATFTGTISGDNATMSGSWSSNAGQNGTWTATRTEGPPMASPTPGSTATAGPSSTPTATTTPSPDGRRKSAALVGCNKQLLLGGPSTFVCSAMIADASGKPPLVTPTGTITFALDTGAPGSFAGAARGTCTLQQVTAGAAASCSVTYTPGREITSGIQPAMTAFYSGDAAVAPTSGRPTARLATVSGQIFDPQTIYIATRVADACSSAAKAPKAKKRWTGIPVASAAFTLPYYAFRPDSTAVDKALTLGANGTAFVINLVPYCVGGASWATGKVVTGLGDDRIVMAELAAGAGSMALGFEPGGVLIPIGGAQYFAGKTVGPGLTYAGDVVIKDPPDKRFRTVARPEPVPKVKLPGMGAAGKRVLALHAHLARATAYANALATAVNRAATARKAKDRGSVGKQSRAILSFARGVVRELSAAVAGIDAAETAVDTALAKRVPLTQAQLTRAKKKIADDGLPKPVAKALRQLGVPAKRVERAVAGLTLETSVPAGLQLGSLLPTALRLEIAKFQLIARIPDLRKDARLRG